MSKDLNHTTDNSPFDNAKLTGNTNENILIKKLSSIYRVITNQTSKIINYIYRISKDFYCIIVFTITSLSILCLSLYVHNDIQKKNNEIENTKIVNKNLQNMIITEMKKQTDKLNLLHETLEQTNNSLIHKELHYIHKEISKMNHLLSSDTLIIKIKHNN